MTLKELYKYLKKAEKVFDIPKEDRDKVHVSIYGGTIELSYSITKIYISEENDKKEPS